VPGEFCFSPDADRAIYYIDHRRELYFYHLNQEQPILVAKLPVIRDGIFVDELIPSESSSSLLVNSYFYARNGAYLDSNQSCFIRRYSAEKIKEYSKECSKQVQDGINQVSSNFIPELSKIVMEYSNHPTYSALEKLSITASFNPAVLNYCYLVVHNMNLLLEENLEKLFSEGISKYPYKLENSRSGARKERHHTDLNDFAIIQLAMGIREATEFLESIRQGKEKMFPINKIKYIEIEQRLPSKQSKLLLQTDLSKYCPETEKGIKCKKRYTVS